MERHCLISLRMAYVLILDALELLFVNTPWIVIASFIVLLTWLTAGIRTAIWSGAFLAYMGLLGFWVKAMTTLALLGTAACLSIAIGIPLGMYCARRPRFYKFIQPIMDFMQTMPAFCFHDPSDCVFWNRKTGCCRHYNDFWWDTCGKAHRTGSLPFFVVFLRASERQRFRSAPTNGTCSHGLICLWRVHPSELGSIRRSCCLWRWLSLHL